MFLGVSASEVSELLAPYLSGSEGYIWSLGWLSNYCKLTFNFGVANSFGNQSGLCHSFTFWRKY